MSTPAPPPVQTVPRWALGAIIVVHLCITSFNYIMVRPGLREFAAPEAGLFAALPFALLRFLISSAVLWGVLLARRWRPVAGQDWWSLLWLAVLAVPLNQLPYLIGIGMVPPEHGALIYATTPIWVLLVARLLLGEPITKLKLIGIPLAFLGVCIVFFEHGVEFNNTLLGDLILVFGVLGWALYSVQGKPLSTRYGALQVTTLAISLGTVTFIPVMPHYLSRVDYGAISPLAWASLAYMAVLTSAVAYTLWYWLMGQMETGKVAVLQNLQPVFTILFTALLVDAGWAGLFAIQGHAITPVFLAGAALTLAGVLITQRG